MKLFLVPSSSRSRRWSRSVGKDRDTHSTLITTCTLQTSLLGCQVLLTGFVTPNAIQNLLNVFTPASVALRSVLDPFQHPIELLYCVAIPGGWEGGGRGREGEEGGWEERGWERKKGWRGDREREIERRRNSRKEGGVTD